MSRMMRRSIKSLGNDKYFKKLIVTPTKQSGVADAMTKAKQYIREGKIQVKIGKEALSTGKIPGTSRKHSPDVVKKWGKDKIRLGRANKLTGTTIFKKIKLRGFSTGNRFKWSGRHYSGYNKGTLYTISRDGVSKGAYRANKWGSKVKYSGNTSGRDLGWGKISSKPSLGKNNSSFGEGLSRGLIRYKTQKLKRGKGIFGQGSNGTMVQ